MNSFQTTLDGKNPVESYSNDGNVVIGFCTEKILMLDLDFHTSIVAKKFVRSYAVYHKLGSALLLKTSDSKQIDLFGNRLSKYAVVFGKIISWQEIQWHIKECRRLGMIERSFMNLRKFGSITIRVNAKNDNTPPPKIVKLYKIGDMTGINQFCEFKEIAEPLGKNGFMNA